MEQQNKQNDKLEFSEKVVIELDQKEIEVTEYMEPEEVVKYFEEKLNIFRVNLPKESVFIILDKEKGEFEQYLNKGFTDAYNKGWLKAVVKGYNDKPVFLTKVYNEWNNDFKGITFDPSTTDRRVGKDKLNTFNGFTVSPMVDFNKLDVLPFINFIDTVYGYKNKEYGAKLIAWIADIFYNPAEKSGTAFAIKGGQGSGKSLLFNTLKRLLGTAAFTATKPEHLTGKHNTHLADNLLIIGEEVAFGGDKEAMNKFKTMITQDTITIEPKFINAYETPDFSRLVILTNEDYPIGMEKDDRRWTLLETNPKMTEEYRKDNPDSIEALIMEQFYQWGQEEENLQKLLRFLLEIGEKTKGQATTNMETEAGNESKKLSAGLMYQWLDSLIEAEEESDFADKVLGKWAKSTELMQVYLEYAKETGHRITHINPTYFGKEIGKFLEKKRKTEGQGYTVPNKKELKVLLDKHLGFSSLEE